MQRESTKTWTEVPCPEAPIATSLPGCRNLIEKTRCVPLHIQEENLIAENACVYTIQFFYMFLILIQSSI